MSDTPNGDSRPLRLAFFWTIILACAAMIFYHDVQSGRVRQESSVVSGFQLEMGSRYALGVKAVMNSAQAIPSLEASLRENAQSPLDRLRLIPVIGQLEGDGGAVTAADEWLAHDGQPDLAPDVVTLRSIYRGEQVDADQIQSLQDRYGIFGQLAAARQQGSDGPLQQKIDRLAHRAFWASLATIGMVGLSLIAGLVLLIIFSVQFFDHKMRPRLQRAAIPVADALLEGFALYLLGMTTIMLALPLLGVHGIGWDALLVVPVAMGVCWARWQIGGKQLAEAVGWWSGKGIFREMWAGFVGYIAGVPVVAGGMLITLLLMKKAVAAGEHPVADHPIVYQLQHPGWPRVFIVFLACVFAPITEELMFRGMLLGHLRARFGWLLSALLVSLIFAGIHPQGWMAIPVLGSLAMVLAALREQRESLIAPMTAHALNNTSLLVVFLWAMG
jgi:membrane protease YdiL (CAAX protease family)